MNSLLHTDTRTHICREDSVCLSYLFAHYMKGLNAIRSKQSSSAADISSSHIAFLCPWRPVHSSYCSSHCQTSRGNMIIIKLQRPILHQSLQQLHRYALVVYGSIYLKLRFPLKWVSHLKLMQQKLSRNSLCGKNVDRTCQDHHKKRTFNNHSGCSYFLEPQGQVETSFCALQRSLYLNSAQYWSIGCCPGDHREMETQCVTTTQEKNQQGSCQ